jgi:hypothetical protein
MSDGPVVNEIVGMSLPTQRFSVTAAISERTQLSLTEEFVVRFVYLMGNARFIDIVTFFAFDKVEVEALISWMIRDGYLTSAGGTIRLGGRGIAAINEAPEYSSLNPSIVRPIETVESLTLERVAYSLVTFVRRPPYAALDLQKREPRFDVPQEVARAVDTHFSEWVRTWSDNRLRNSAEALFGVLDVRSEAHLATYAEATINLYVATESYRVELSIPQIQNLPETKSRRALMASMRGFLEAAAAAPSTRLALPVLGLIDNGTLSQYYRMNQFDYARFIIDRRVDPEGTITFVGSCASGVAKMLLLEMTANPRSPLLWLRPSDGFWGTSFAYSELFEKLSTLYAQVGGMRLIYAGSHAPVSARSARKRFIERGGPFTKLSCLPIIDNNIGLEIICEPGRWAMLILRGIDHEQESGIPISVGFFSVDRRICESVERLLAKSEDDVVEDTAAAG